MAEKKKFERQVLVILIILTVIAFVVGWLAVTSIAKADGPTQGQEGAWELPAYPPEKTCHVILAGEVGNPYISSLFWWVGDTSKRVACQDDSQIQGWFRLSWVRGQHCYWYGGIALPPGRYVFNVENEGAQHIYSREVTVTPGFNLVVINVRQ